MTTVTIGNQDATYLANQAGTTYLLEAGTTIETQSGDGIQANSNAANRTFLINGEINAHAEGIELGDYINPGSYAEAARLEIGQTGYLHSSGNGLFLLANNSAYNIEGVVDARYHGIFMQGDNNRVTNSGQIHAGGDAIELFHDGNVINNSGAITGTDNGVVIEAFASDTRIVNSGWISGSRWAVFSYSGTDTLINSGRIFGSVYLGEGGDHFVSKGGFVTGLVNGGDGDDRYIVGGGKVNLVEDAGSGNDTVKSSVSWTLGDNFEQAFLTGRKNINLTGNDDGSILTGNAASNKIAGMLGDDVITGGRGNDVMTGDNGQVAFGGSDTFVFKHHSGHDAITDFHNGEDVLDLTHYDGLDSFADLKGHIKQVGDNVVVTLLDGDHFTLQATHKADLDASDFAF